MLRKAYQCAIKGKKYIGIEDFVLSYIQIVSGNQCF